MGSAFIHGTSIYGPVLLLQSTVLGMEAARHYAAAITLLQGLDHSPVDPATLAGADVSTLVALDEAR